MTKCYLVVHNAQNQHVVAVCKNYEDAVVLKERVMQRVGLKNYCVIEKDFIW